jgi:hypothetical protein
MSLKSFLIGLILACAAGAASAQPAAPGPSADYKTEADLTQKSPDGSIIIEQYIKDGDDPLWQFWVRRSDTLALLNAEPSDYAAGFRFTNDLQWLVRMQKTGSGESTMYLYRSSPTGFVEATKKPIGDLAWAFFKSRPEWKKVMKPDFHMTADLVKGTEESYRWLGVDWPDNRYIVIGLGGEVEPTHKHGQIISIDGWLCRYDLKTGAFDVPAAFLKDNAKAIVPKSLRSLSAS